MTSELLFTCQESENYVTSEVTGSTLGPYAVDSPIAISWCAMVTKERLAQEKDYILAKYLVKGRIMVRKEGFLCVWDSYAYARKWKGRTHNRSSSDFVSRKYALVLRFYRNVPPI